MKHVGLVSIAEHQPGRSACTSAPKHMPATYLPSLRLRRKATVRVSRSFWKMVSSAIVISWLGVMLAATSRMSATPRTSAGVASPARLSTGARDCRRRGRTRQRRVVARRFPGRADGGQHGFAFHAQHVGIAFDDAGQRFVAGAVLANGAGAGGRHGRQRRQPSGMVELAHRLAASHRAGFQSGRAAGPNAGRLRGRYRPWSCRAPSRRHRFVVALPAPAAGLFQCSAGKRRPSCGPARAAASRPRPLRHRACRPGR